MSTATASEDLRDLVQSASDSFARATTPADLENAKAQFLGKAGLGHFYVGWEQFAPLPRRWLRQCCARLAAQLRAEGEPWLEHFEDDEDF